MAQSTGITVINRSGVNYKRYGSNWDGVFGKLAHSSVFPASSLALWYFKDPLKHIVSEENIYRVQVTCLAIPILHSLYRRIYKRIPFDQNLAPGLAGSVYDGYLNLLSAGKLPQILEALEVIAIPRIILVFPFNGTFLHNLETIPEVTTVGKIKVAQLNRGGQTMRGYEVTVFEIQYENKFYYCLLEEAMGIDNINQHVQRNLGYLSPEYKQCIRNREYSNYVRCIEDRVNDGIIPDSNNDVFALLLCKDISAKEIIEGMNDFCKAKGYSDGPKSFDGRLNFTARIKQINHRGVVTDKLVKTITPTKDGLYDVELKGNFLAGEDTHVRLSMDEVRGAEDALANANVLRPQTSRPFGMVTVLPLNEFSDDCVGEILSLVAREISMKWKPLFRELVNRPSEINRIESKIISIERSEDMVIAEQARKSLDEWWNMEGHRATVNKLCEVLESRTVDRKKIADDVRSIVRQYGRQMSVE